MLTSTHEIRRRSFVDRQQEIALFQDALNNTKPKWNILGVSGVGGIGKTYLLDVYFQICQSQKIPFISIDAYTLRAASGIGIAIAAHEQLKQSGHKRYLRKYESLLAKYKGSLKKEPRKQEEDETLALLDEFSNVLNRIADKNGRLVFAFDSFERHDLSVEDWLVNKFVSKASKNILLILSGRDRLGRAWEKWRPITYSIELQPFTNEAIREYARISGISGIDDATLQVSGGHPLYVALLMEVIAREGQLDQAAQAPPSTTAIGQINLLVVERLLKYLDSPTRAVLEVLAVLPTADEAALRFMLDEKQPIVLSELTRLSFIRLLPEQGISLHDTVKGYLLSALRQVSFSRYVELNRQAVKYYLQELEATNNEARWLSCATAALNCQLALDQRSTLELFANLVGKTLRVNFLKVGLALIAHVTQLQFNDPQIRSRVDEVAVDRKRVIDLLETYLEYRASVSVNRVKVLLGLLGEAPAEINLSSARKGLALCRADLRSVFEGILVDSTLPIIIAAIDISSEDHADQIRGLLESSELKRHQVCLVLVPQDNVTEKTLKIADKLRSAYAYDVIVLGVEDIFRIASSPDSQRSMRSLALSRVNLLNISPFVVNGPVPDNIFSGREVELRIITESAERLSFALIGGRRIGKSSLLSRLHHARLPTAGFRTIYHDCSTTPTHGEFVGAIVRDWRPEPPSDAPSTFGDLTLCLSKTQSSLTDKPLVLLLDEADKLVPADRLDGWRLFKTLRALANSGLAQFVLSGERTLREALRDSTSPLFNFVNEMLLGPLDFRSVEELVTRPMKQLEIELVGEEAIVRRIYDFTSGHPNVVQRLCRRLIERLNEVGARRITVGDVRAVIDDPAFQRDDFLSTYWEAATPLEKITSLLMANNEEICTLSAIRQAIADRCSIQPKAHDVDDALQRLVDLRSILKRTPQGYAFAIEAFPRVVKGTVTLQDMLEVLVEEYREQSE